MLLSSQNRTSSANNHNISRSSWACSWARVSSNHIAVHSWCKDHTASGSGRIRWRGVEGAVNTSAACGLADGVGQRPCASSEYTVGSNGECGEQEQERERESSDETDIVEPKCLRAPMRSAGVVRQGCPSLSDKRARQGGASRKLLLDIQEGPSDRPVEDIRSRSPSDVRRGGPSSKLPTSAYKSSPIDKKCGCGEVVQR